MAADFKLLEAYIQLSVQEPIATIHEAFKALMNDIKNRTNKQYTIKLKLQETGKVGSGTERGSKEVTSFLRNAKADFADLKVEVDGFEKKMDKLRELIANTTKLRAGTQTGSVDDLRLTQFRTQLLKEQERVVQQLDAQERKIARDRAARAKQGTASTKKVTAAQNPQLVRARQFALEVSTRLRTIAASYADAGTKARQYAALQAQVDKAMAKTVVTGKALNVALGAQVAAQNAAASAQKRAANASAQPYLSAVRKIKNEFLEIRRSQDSSAQKIQRLAALEKRVAGILANSKLTIAQQNQLSEVGAKIAERRLAIENATAKAMRDRVRIIVQQLNSASLEAGFLFGPKTQAIGNFFRLGSAGFRAAQAFGLAATAATGVGAVVGGLAIVFKTLSVALGFVFRAALAVARTALSALASALRVVFAPTLQFISLVQRLIQQLPLLAAALTGLVTRSLIQVGQQLQRINATFGLAFGSRAGKELEFVRKQAYELGLPLAEVADQYSRIAFSANVAGISQRDQIDLFKGVGKAAIGMGLEAERVSGIFFALEQVISKGTLSSEELKRQLGDRLPGAFQVAARALRVTDKELTALLKKGEINSAQFIGAFGRELQRTFGGAARQQVQGLTANINRLKTGFFELQLVLAQKAAPALTKVLIELNKLLTRLRTSDEFAQFAAFVSKSFEDLAAVIPRVAAEGLRMLREWRPLLSQIARDIMVLNTIAFTGMIKGLEVVLPLLERVVLGFERIFNRITGLDLSKLTFSIKTIKAVFENFDSIVEIVGLQFKSMAERIKHEFDSIDWVGIWARMLKSAASAALNFQDLINRVAFDMFKNVLEADPNKIFAPSQDAMMKQMKLAAERMGFDTFTFSEQEKLDRLQAEFGRNVEKIFEPRPLEAAGRSLRKAVEQQIAGVKGLYETVYDRIRLAIGDSVAKFGKSDEDKDRDNSSIVRIEDIRAQIEDSLLNRDQKAVVDNTAKTTELLTTTNRLLGDLLNKGGSAVGEAVGSVFGSLMKLRPGGAI